MGTVTVGLFYRHLVYRVSTTAGLVGEAFVERAVDSHRDRFNRWGYRKMQSDLAGLGTTQEAQP